MVYRELEANRIDEGGKTYIIDGEPSNDFVGTTRIVVQNEALVACHEARDTIFLPQAARGALEHSTADVEVFDAPSKHLYYRGMRVYDLPKPALRTYNVLRELELTEDRTLRYAFWAEWAVAAHVLATEDERLVRDVLRATSGDAWEAGLTYSGAPSETVKRVVSFAPAEMRAHETALGRHVVSTYEKPKARDPFESWPRPWSRDGATVLDTNGCVLMEVSDEVERAERESLLDTMIAAVNAYRPPVGDDEVPL
jgi:hypothetical protein